MEMASATKMPPHLNWEIWRKWWMVWTCIRMELFRRLWRHQVRCGRYRPMNLRRRQWLISLISDTRRNLPPSLMKSLQVSSNWIWFDEWIWRIDNELMKLRLCTWYQAAMTNYWNEGGEFEVFLTVFGSLNSSWENNCCSFIPCWIQIIKNRWEIYQLFPPL